MEVGKTMPENGVIRGHQIIYTKDAKWLCLDDMYIKLHRPNQYDIGGTMVEDIPDFWFQLQTEHADKLFLIHIFVYNRCGTAFDVSISANNDIIVNEKINSVFLTPNLKNYAFKNVKCKTLYLTTFCFTELVADSLKNRKLFIPISLDSVKKLDICKSDDNLIFETLLKDPVGADFTMESADGHKFDVHKVLLSTFSEVFEAMLKEDTAESQNSYVKLVDVSKEDLTCILEFIYTGIVKNKPNYNFFTILMLADRYDVKGLKELSEHVLSYQISEDSVVETLVVADLHNSQYLKRAAFQFIKENPKSIHSDMFKELGNMELVQEIFKCLIPTN